MEPVFFVLGQSAATAAVLAVEGATDVQKVDYEKLSKRLLADKQVLDYASPKKSENIELKKLSGIVIDDENAMRQGFDAVSTSAFPYVGTGYRHDGAKDQGKQTARYVPEIPETGMYQVRMSYSPNPNRATNVQVTINHADGKIIAKVNQKKAPTIDGAFALLGTFRFEKGKTGFVEISNTNADGHVIIDAVQWLPIRNGDKKN